MISFSVMIIDIPLFCKNFAQNFGLIEKAQCYFDDAG